MNNITRFLRFAATGITPSPGSHRNVMTGWVVRYVVLAVLALPPMHAANATASDDAVAFMRNLLSRAIEVMNDKTPLAARQDRFRQTFQSDFDCPRIARFVLGSSWREASSAEQQEFLQLFGDYVVLVYSTRLADFSGETFKVRGSRTDDEGVIVSTDIITRGHPTPLRVDWRLTTSGGNFKVTDVIVDGISMMVTERAEFASVIRRHGGGIGGLLGLMRERTAAVEPAAQ